MLDTTLAAADRSSLLGFSDIVRIRNRVMEMRARGQRVLQLEGGEPFMPTPDFVKEAMRAALDADHTRYAPSSGIPQLLDALREKLASKNELDVTAKDIIVTSGGAHGLFCAFQASVNRGDEVMFFSPYWTPIRDQVCFAGGVPVRVPWDEVRGRDDLTEALESRRTYRTRVIYVNSPANPSGDVLSRAQLASVADFARANNLVVIADDAYEDLHYDGQHTSIAALPEMHERTIAVYTLSKSFSMTGWRIGYVVAPEPFMELIRKLVLNTTNGVSTPTQHAAVAAISHDPHFFDPILEGYRRRRDLLVGGLRDAGFDCLTPPGAFYAFPDVRTRLGGDSWKAMETLLDRTSIASVPGAVFGPEGEGHLRMSFSTSTDVLEEAVHALRSA
ncbi:MAG TPA: aminotransferase class I/II-fold pyridoxal phosphate-dependent enzyme [Thermoanaerobaculia bacterium]|nr:aminotransferase class I/II-fold pyridoxal phosphate-dependent enzyme [Thermoanaerobaculia bacterium]